MDNRTPILQAWVMTVFYLLSLEEAMVLMQSKIGIRDRLVLKSIFFTSLIEYSICKRYEIITIF